MNIKNKIIEICNRTEKSIPGFTEEFLKLVCHEENIIEINETTKLVILNSMMAGVELGYSAAIKHTTRPDYRMGY